MKPKQFPDDPRFYFLGAGDNPQTQGVTVTRVAWPGIDAEIDAENKKAFDESMEALGHPPIHEPRRKPSSIFMCWQLSPEEIAQVSQSGEIWIGVMTSRAGTQPPIVAIVGTPDENGFVQLTREGDLYEAPLKK